MLHGDPTSNIHDPLTGHKQHTFITEQFFKGEFQNWYHQHRMKVSREEYIFWTFPGLMIPSLIP